MPARPTISLLAFVLVLAGIGLAEAEDPRPVDPSSLASPILFTGDRVTAYRDPTAVFHDGVFHLYFTLCRVEEEGAFWYLGHSRSRDLKTWTEPERLTPRDRKLNFSSPGNVIRYGGRWVICLQTYPTPQNQTYGTGDARIWIMCSDDLRRWDEPELLRVKGPEVPQERMGRMIDPYLLRDSRDPEKWWCFYKQSGVSMSHSRDLKTWTYVGRRSAGENVCVLRRGDRYVMFHSPRNGIGVLESRELPEWKDTGQLITLGQKDWPWAQGRLTAGFVLDLRQDPRTGKSIMFFHGASREGLKMHGAHGHASLALAWSDDLKSWSWPGKE